MVGGDEAVFRKVLPVLETIGAKDQITHVGAIGAGNVAKLAHNQLYMVTSAAIAEAFTMGVKAGVAPEALFKVVSGGAFGRGMLLQGLPAVVFKGNFDRPATFALKLARKDLALATELGREFQVPMPLAAVVEQELIKAVVRGWTTRTASPRSRCRRNARASKSAVSKGCARRRARDLSAWRRFGRQALKFCGSRHQRGRPRFYRLERLSLTGFHR
jgi:3-hydroxyisobutyrate dehydrogenase-like beta-hydroxyacid dehydrogenase